MFQHLLDITTLFPITSMYNVFLLECGHNLHFSKVVVFELEKANHMHMSLRPIAIWGSVIELCTDCKFELKTTVRWKAVTVGQL